MKVLDKISEKFNFIMLRLAVVFLGALSIVMILQVFCRYVLNNSLSWSEEFSRYCFIWFNCAGATVLTREISHARISVIDGLFKGKLSNRIYWIILDIIMIVLSVMLLITGLEVTKVAHPQLTAALQIPKSFVYASTVLAGGGMLVHLIPHILGLILGTKEAGAGSAFCGSTNLNEEEEN